MSTTRRRPAAWLSRMWSCADGWMRNKPHTGASSRRTKKASRGRRSLCRSFKPRYEGFVHVLTTVESTDQHQPVLLHQVLQYKKRCGDLEQTLQEKSSELERCSVGTNGFFIHFLRKNIIFTAQFSSLQYQFLTKMLFFQERSETSNGRHQEDSNSSLEDALIRLEEEQQR